MRDSQLTPIHIMNYMQALGESFENFYAAQDLDANVFHYTSTEAAKSLIASNEFWLTDTNCTNDTEEVKHGLQLARDELEKTHSLGQARQKGKLLPIIYEHMEKLQQPHIFFMSFTSLRDNIGQFRWYADDAKGAMLSFSSQSLQRGILACGQDGKISRDARLVKVIYDDEKKVFLIKQLIMIFGAYMTQLFSQKMFYGRVRNLLMMNFCGQLYQLVSSFKETGWSDENEVRLAVTLLSNESRPEVGKTGLRIPFERQRKDITVPYMKAFSIKHRPPSNRPDGANYFTEVQQLRMGLGLNEIIMGPNGDAAKNYYAMKEFLSETAYKDIAIDRCKIGYNN